MTLLYVHYVLTVRHFFRRGKGVLQTQDICYGQCIGKDHCDAVFCVCLDAAVDVAPDKCQGAGSLLCEAVRQAGGPAYEASCGDT